MASGREPRGTVTRHLSDWNAPNVNTIWGTANGSGTFTSTTGFQNVDTRGWQMIVWGMEVTSQITGTATQLATSQGFWAYGIIPPGAISGATYADINRCVPLSPLYPQALVDLWTSTAIAGILDSYQLGRPVAGNGNIAVFSPFPLAIVPANYSFVATYIATLAGGAGATGDFTIYFEMSPVDH